MFLNNGNKLLLPQVTLAPSGTAVISINDALQQQNIAPGTPLSGYVEIDYRWPWDPICVTIRNVDTAHSLIFVYSLDGPPQTPAPGHHAMVAPLQANVLEGFWWKQEPNVTGFVSLSNISSTPTHASIRITNDGLNVLAQHNITVLPHNTQLVDLPELVATDTQGGVHITYDGANESLVVNGGLKDAAVGYSARMPLHFPPVGSAATMHLSYASLGLMIGAADPMMSFPAGTIFTPYSIMRNISDQPVSVTPTLWWMEGIVPHSARLPGFTVLPSQTRSLDVPLLVAQAGLTKYNGSLNLTLDVDGEPRGLLIASGSVDQTNNYVFEVHTTAIAESVTKSISYWSTGDGDDTMVTLWNPADEAQDFLFALSFAGGDGHYNWPIRLEARATRMFNISELIHSELPDAEGNIIPPTVHEGKAEIMGAQGENQHILVAIDAGTYNVQKATCGQWCLNCGGATGSLIYLNPFAVAKGGTRQLSFTVQYKSGAQYDHTAVAAWSSSNTSMATVNAGLVSGIAPGSFVISANDPNVPDYSYACYGSNTDLYCPQETGQESSGSGDVVTATVSIHTSGQKSSGDKLNFNNGVACSENLGLENCSGFWGFNVEIQADVSDDASKWNVSQTVTSGRSKGYYKNADKTLTPFDDSEGTSSDNPDSSNVQQISGDKTIYWIDDPGINKTNSTGASVDSVTEVLNFTSKVCSQTDLTACFSANWHIKVVVNSGGVLDSTKSTAGTGSLSTTF